MDKDKSSSTDSCQVDNKENFSLIVPSNFDKALASGYLLDNLFLPFLKRNKTKQTSMLRSSLHLTYAKKFTLRVCNFLEQQKNGVQLKEVSRTHDEKELESFERVAVEWNLALRGVIETELNQKRKNNLPLGEVEFWKRRNIVLSDIMEQIKSERVRKVMKELTRQSKHSIVAKFNENTSTLSSLFVESTENVRFLKPLERHFRTLNEGSLSSITTSALPSLLDCMRLVYVREERLLPMLLSIRDQILVRVSFIIRPSVLLKDSNYNEAKETLENVKALLECFKTSYSTTLEKIECTQRRRWEFDHITLFQATDYIASICSKFIVIVESFAELALVVAKSGGEVKSMMTSIERLKSKFVESLDAFDFLAVESSAQLEESVDLFWLNFEQVETEIKEAFERMFDQFSSSENAFHFYQNVRRTNTRAEKLLEGRSKDLLKRFWTELDEAMSTFRRAKANAPKSKSAGLFSSLSDIIRRVEKPFVLLDKDGEILDSPRGTSLRLRYEQFIKDVVVFKEDSFREWVLDAKECIEEGLRRPLLKRVIDKDSQLAIIQTNFSQSLKNVLEDTSPFLELGFHVPKTIVSLSTHLERFSRYEFDLKKIVHAYNSMLQSLTKTERVILEKELTTLDKDFISEMETCNLKSQLVEPCIAQARKCLDTFRSNLLMKRKVLKQTNNILKSLECYNLLQTTKRETIEAAITRNGQFFSALLQELSSHLENLEKEDSSIPYDLFLKRIYKSCFECAARSVLSILYLGSKSSKVPRDRLVKEIFIAFSTNILESKTNSIENAITYKQLLLADPSIKTLVESVVSN